MKHVFYICLICSTFLICSLTSCNLRADVDLSDVDMTTAVGAHLSLPLGSVSAKFGDFLGTNSFEQISIDEQGRYLFSDTISVSRSYHPINLADYVSKTSATWNISDELYQLGEKLEDILNDHDLGFDIDIDLDMWFELFDHITIPGGATFELEFPVTLDLRKLNIDYSYQRVDSLIVDSALFTSRYTFHNIDFDWSCIKNIQLILNENFRREEGDTLDLLQPGKNFGEAMPIEVSKFHLILMEDPNGESNGDNIVETIDLKIRFKIENTSPLVIYKDSYIRYDFELSFIDYSAMFGFFAASDLMRDEFINQPIHEVWSGWNLFQGWILPVSEPSVKFIVDHTLAVPMIVNLQSISAQSENEEIRYATFDDSKSLRSKSIHWPMQIAVTDPLDKHAFDTILLDYTPSNGNIDTLLTIHPYSVSYLFSVSTDSTSDVKQFRITDNTNINLDAILHIPFAFHDSVHITYSDTLRNINLTQIQLDSMLQEIELIDSIEEAELQLYVTIENGIPFDIEGEFTLIDTMNNVVQLSTMEEPSFKIAIDYPYEISNNVASIPSINHMPVLKIRKEDFAKLSSVKHIFFHATLGNNYHSVNLTPDATMRIAIGLTADFDAIVDLKQLN